MDLITVWSLPPPGTGMPTFDAFSIVVANRSYIIYFTTPAIAFTIAADKTAITNPITALAIVFFALVMPSEDPALVIYSKPPLTIKNTVT